MSLRLFCLLLCWLASPMGLLSAKAGVIHESDLDVGPYQMIRPVSSVIIHNGEVSPGDEALYNGVGLTDDNPLFAEHGTDPDTIWEYEISEDEYPVSVEFDLGDNFLVSEMWIWQPKTENGSDRGIEDFDIIMRDENGVEVGVLSNGIDQIKSTGMQPITRFAAFGECVILPFPDCVRFVELRIRSNLGDPEYVSLAEVAFAGRAKNIGVPEPASVRLVCFGALAVAQIGLRRSARARSV